MKPLKTLIVTFLCIYSFTNLNAQGNVVNDALNLTEDIIAAFRNAPATQERSILNLYNNTGKDIWFALAYWDAANNCWTSKGWYHVEGYKGRNIDFGGYIGKVYIHGYRKALWGLSEVDWGSGASFCIDKRNAFEIRYAVKSPCNNKAEFSEFSLSPGINKWMFNQ